ncbi:hypothetical protein A3I45_01505 [Candidatus Uhrbacteria bacterium RIFCSPLOWO2_02_FULL_53_10]|uniref:Response regulatory domain-containing protein n=1 Tax=Candidatus Uhrbacteria bacterium RIFCSPLOWO2_02_FULL_53_10 TaxID=1802411 RepID=A0A1F7VIJ2_9BACT|nr:MAG: hypothetical protein A3I45_01505 [Candidatus Uhrbacteria bacterium RIFCSPLOWO2_02_FULL_53_10]
MGDALGQEGFSVLSALDGEAGLRLAKDKLPDVILLDLILPKANAFDVLRTLKGHEETKHIPVVVLTNLESMEDVQKALDLGAMSYLVKANYKLEEVIEKVRQAL